MRLFFLYGLIITTMAIWGFNVIVIKVLVTTFPTLTITALRVSIAFLSILPFVILRKPWSHITKRDSILLVGIAVTTILGHQFFMSVGLNYTTAVNGGLILGTVPIVTSVFAAIFLKESFNRHKVIGVLCGFIGVSVIILSGTDYKLSINLGDILFVCTVISQAIGFILVKKISASIDTITITGVSQLVGGSLLYGVSLGFEPMGITQLDQASWMMWLLLFFSGSIATGAGHFMYNISIREIGAGKSAVFLNLTPFFTILGSYLFLSEEIYYSHWIGFGLVVLGVLFGTEFIKKIAVKTLEKRLSS